MHTSLRERDQQHHWVSHQQEVAHQTRNHIPKPPKTSAFKEAEAPCGFERLVQEPAAGPGMDVGTSPSPLSFSGGPSLASSQARSPTLHGDMEQHCLTMQRVGDGEHLGCLPVASSSSGLLSESASATSLGMSRQKLLSDKISGTGTFLLQRDESCYTEAALRPLPLDQRSPEEQEQVVKHAYVSVEAVCQALVPGESMDLLDALMDTSEVYRARYGSKKLDFNDQKQQQQAAQQLEAGRRAALQQDSDDDGPGDEVVPITQRFRGVGTFCLRRDKNTRKRRSEFVRLARSQRARVVKTAYEVVQAVTELFCPGERLLLLDRIFSLHHTIRARIHKKTTAALAAYPEAAALAGHAALLSSQVSSSSSTTQQPAGGSRRTTQQASSTTSSSSSISSSSATTSSNRKRPPPSSSSSSSAMLPLPLTSSASSDSMWLTSPTSADNTDDDDEAGGSLCGGGSSKHFRPDPSSSSTGGAGGGAGSAGSSSGMGLNPSGHPGLNWAAQQWALMLAANAGVSPVFMPSGSSGGGAGGGALALAALPFPYAHHHQQQQHMMMMAATANPAAAATPYFFPALSHPSAAISPSCQTHPWSPGPEAADQGSVTGAGAGPDDDDDDDVYGGALDDSSSSTLTSSRGTVAHQGGDTTTIDGMGAGGGAGSTTTTMTVGVRELGITQV